MEEFNKFMRANYADQRDIFYLNSLVVKDSPKQLSIMSQPTEDGDLWTLQLPKSNGYHPNTTTSDSKSNSSSTIIAVDSSSSNSSSNSNDDTLKRSFDCEMDSRYLKHWVQHISATMDL